MGLIWRAKAKGSKGCEIGLLGISRSGCTTTASPAAMLVSAAKICETVRLVKGVV